MSTAQYEDLLRVMGGEVCITQISCQASSIHAPIEAMAVEVGEVSADIVLEGQQPALKELIMGYDEVAAVLPIGMLQQLLPICPSGRVLQAISKRILLEDGSKVQFAHDKWQAVKEIRIVTEDL